MSANAEVNQMSGAGDGLNLESIHGDLVCVRTVLEGCVLVSGKEKQLKLMHSGIVLADQGNNSSSKKNKALSLSWRDIICAARDLKSPPGPTVSSFTLHYIDHKANSKLRVRTLTMTHPGGQADQWVTAVNDNCQKVSGRPKKAFVVVNPIGGASRGRQIYEKTVAPLFQLAGIQTTVAITERSKHAIELGEQQDFSGYDVIVIVGGDGLYQEVLLGLTLQTQRKAHVDYNNPDSVLCKPDIAFGIIPAGTGNGLIQFCNGTTDEVTAALSIVQGESLKAQMFTVHSCGKLITVSGFFFAYGESSDLIKMTDDRRWMGRMRYPYCIIRWLLKKPRMFHCNIEYRLADQQEKQNNDIGSDASSSQETEWTVYTGNSGPVSGFISTASEYIVNGKDLIISPQGKCADLIVNFGGSHIDLWKAMNRSFKGKNAAGPLPPKLECISKITGFRIKVTPDVAESETNISAARAKEIEMEKVLNIDGEVVYVDKPEMDIRLHSDFVTLYGCVRLPDAAKAV